MNDIETHSVVQGATSYLKYQQMLREWWKSKGKQIYCSAIQTRNNMHLSKLYHTSSAPNSKQKCRKKIFV